MEDRTVDAKVCNNCKALIKTKKDKVTCPWCGEETNKPETISPSKSSFVFSEK